MLLRNQKLEELEKYCKKDPAKHAFTLYDIRYMRENTDIYVDWDSTVKGYMLIYRATSVPSVIIHGQRDSVKKFLKILDLDKAIIHVPYTFEKMLDGKSKYRILIMARPPAEFHTSDDIIEIRDASLLISLFKDPDYLVKNVKTWGIIKDGKAISSVSALAQTPEVCVMGALITAREWRRMGFASKLVTHFLNTAYGKTKNVVLWVRDDNMPAIKLYRNFGFRQIGEEAWINVGVDIMP